MSDYISREAAIDALREAHRRNTTTIVRSVVAIQELPAADVREVVTCEECEWHVDVGYHYCNKWCAPCPNDCEFYCAYGERPNCGADMRREIEHETNSRRGNDGT